MSEDTISVREAVEMYLAATGSSPSLEPQVLAELREPGMLPLNLLGIRSPTSSKMENRWSSVPDSRS